jgi:Xaa-Pro dipeptidase
MERQRLDLLVVLPQWLFDDALYVANQSGAVIFPRDPEPTLLIGGEGSKVAIASDGWIADRRSATAVARQASRTARPSQAACAS